MTGSECDGDIFLLSGTADQAEADLIIARVNQLLPGLDIRYSFRPRPTCYYMIEAGDTWETISDKVFGTKLLALTIFMANSVLYTANNQVPDFLRNTASG